jgi:hypothetical protein
MKGVPNLVKVTLLAVFFSGSLSHADVDPNLSIKQLLKGNGEEVLTGMIRCAGLYQHLFNAIPNSEKTEEMRSAMQTMGNIYKTTISSVLKDIGALEKFNISESVDVVAGIYKKNASSPDIKEVLKLDLKQCSDYIGETCKKTGKC